MVVVDVVNEEEEEKEEETNGRCRFLVMDETTVEENEYLVGTWSLMNKEERHMISFLVPNLSQSNYHKPQTFIHFFFVFS